MRLAGQDLHGRDSPVSLGRRKASAKRITSCRCRLGGERPALDSVQLWVFGVAFCSFETEDRDASEVTQLSAAIGLPASIVLAGAIGGILMKDVGMNLDYGFTLYARSATLIPWLVIWTAIGSLLFSLTERSVLAAVIIASLLLPAPFLLFKAVSIVFHVIS